MCGDLDDDPRESGFYQRFLAHSQALLAAASPTEAGLNGYLDGLFAQLLQRCRADLQQGDPAEAYHKLAMQSLVLARLGGFLAGHVGLNEDPLRKLMEATMVGYAEADSAAQGHHHHHHDHDHGHSH
jgi:hypothetical protein